MLRIDDSFEAAVFEMGMNSRNEISRMSRAVKPDIGSYYKYWYRAHRNAGIKREYKKC